MKKLTLSKTNPYLQDPVIRKELIARSVETSCGVEGIKIKLVQAKIEAAKFDIPRRGKKRIYRTSL